MQTCVTRCFNPRFYGEAGRTNNPAKVAELYDSFNPRFYGEAGRTNPAELNNPAKVAVSIPDFMGRPVELAALEARLAAAEGFNPRFYGEAGRTNLPSMLHRDIAMVSIPDFMGRPVELKKEKNHEEHQRFQSPILWGGR